MIKRFTMIAEIDTESGMLNVKTDNEGFTVRELMYVLSLKSMDVNLQVMDPTSIHFERTAHYPDGTTVVINDMDDLVSQIEHSLRKEKEKEND